MDSIQRVIGDWVLPAILYAFFGVLLTVMPNDADADEYTPTKEWRALGNETHDTPELACQFLYASQSYAFEKIVMHANNELAYCYRPTNFQSGQAAAIFSCPHGGTLRNAPLPRMCINAPACPEGQTRQENGSCAAPPIECEPGCNGACGSYRTFKSFRTRTCIDSCIYKLGAGLSVSLSNGYTSVGHDVRENTGASCEGVDETPPTPAPCPECECQKQGKSWGTVNGLVVCHAPGTPGTPPVTKQDPPETKTETPAPTPDNPNPDPVTTETPSPAITITPNPGGGSPDITETVTNPDGSTTSTSQSQESYCQKNPSASVCKQADEDNKKGSWSGSCGAFQCEGDAVNCAIARKIHQDRCDDRDDMQQFEHAASLGKKLLNGEHDADVTSFLNGEGDSNKTINVGGLVSENGSYQFAAQCLSDIQFSIGGHSITVPISKVCPYFEMIGLFLLAAAYLAALRIVEVI